MKKETKSKDAPKEHLPPWKEKDGDAICRMRVVRVARWSRFLMALAYRAYTRYATNL